MNGGDDASANGGGGGGEDAAMVVVDQQPTAPGLLSAAAANNNGGGGNEEAEAVEDEEMAEQQGENGDGVPNATTSSSSSRYSLRKRSRQPLLSIQDNSSKQTGPNSKTSRGGSKKQQQPPSYQADAFGYVDTSTLTDRQFERLLAQYEEDGARKREQKKQRIERGYADDDYPYVPPPEGDRPAFDDLPKEAIQRVFEFLPTVRAVFNLAYQSKYMMSFVEERVSSGVGGGDLLLRMYEAVITCLWLCVQLILCTAMVCIISNIGCGCSGLHFNGGWVQCGQGITSGASLFLLCWITPLLYLSYNSIVELSLVPNSFT